MPSAAMETHKSVISIALHEALLAYKLFLDKEQLVNISLNTGTSSGSSTNSTVDMVDHDNLTDRMMKCIDVVAVTKGPGLEICLRVGCQFAQVIWTLVCIL